MIWRCKICDAHISNIEGEIRELQTHLILCLGESSPNISRSIHSTDHYWIVNLFTSGFKIEVWGPRWPPFNIYALKREVPGTRLTPQSYNNFAQLFTSVCRTFGIVPQPTSFK